MSERADEARAEAAEEALRLRRPLVWLTAITISAVILALVVWWADPAAVWSLLADADPRPLVWAALLFSVTCLLRWYRVLLLLPRDQRRLHAVLGTSAGHAFLNRVLPLRTGELAFPLLLRRATGTPISVGLLYLSVLRLVEVACLVAIYAAALAFWFAESAQTSALGWVLVPLGLLVGFALLVALPPLLRALLRFIADRPALSRSPRSRRLADALRTCRDELARIGLGGLLRLALATAGVWLTLFGVFYFSLRAFGVDVSLAHAIVGSAGGVLTTLLPVNALGSFGTFEAGWAAGFVATGQAVEPVVASGLAMHLLVVAVSGLVAAIGALGLRRPPTQEP